MTLLAGSAHRRRRPRVLVDIRVAIHVVATMMRWLSLTLVVPAGVALWYGESLRPFLVTLVIGFAISYGVEVLSRGPNEIRIREGFLVVSMVWVFAAALGAVPYIIEGGDVSRPIDAYFEAMSGFTTTGASAMADISSHGRGILFWRVFTQWLGGMGIIVLAVAVLARASGGGRALYESEAPGPEFEKLAPRIRETARRLWFLYIGLTVVLTVLLCIVGYTGLSPGMDLYQAVTHALSTMATGGYSPDPRSLESFGGWSQWICAVFMVIAGTNFALLFRAFFRSPRYLWRDAEFRLYLGLMAAFSVVLIVLLYREVFDSFEATVRHAVFQTVSIMTTTGTASNDYALWPQAAIFVIFILMFIGGCAGSTSGSIKVVRIKLLALAIRRDVVTAVHPQQVVPIRVSRRTMEEKVVRGALAFILLWLLLFLLGTVVLLLDAEIRGTGLTAFEGLAASASCVSNVGPAVGFAGPMGSFEPFSDVSTVTMTILMWIGRLELIPVLALLTRSYWRR